LLHGSTSSLHFNGFFLNVNLSQSSIQTGFHAILAVNAEFTAVKVILRRRLEVVYVTALRQLLDHALAEAHI
jgi:hypothetical protein